MGDIGEPIKKIDFEPIPESAPVEEPAPVILPPVPAEEPVPVG